MSRRNRRAAASDAGRAAAAGRRRGIAVLLALVAVTLAAYYPAWHGGLLWDDQQHLTAPALQSLDGLRRIWLEPGATQQYYPLVHSAFWLQHRLWRDSTLGYHLVSILLHAVSAFFVGLVLRRLAIPGAWLAAAVFALHPVHVESVAWITELKNTLSGVFCLGAVLAWLRFDESRRTAPYAALVALFVLALLSKTVTAMLPVVLLVVVWWRRGAIDLRRDLLPLVPLVGLGAAAGMMTAWMERTQIIGGSASEFNFTFVERCLIAGRAAWFYLAQAAVAIAPGLHLPALGGEPVLVVAVSLPGRAPRVRGRPLGDAAAVARAAVRPARLLRRALPGARIRERLPVPLLAGRRPLPVPRQHPGHRHRHGRARCRRAVEVGLRRTHPARCGPRRLRPARRADVAPGRQLRGRGDAV